MEDIYCRLKELKILNLAIWFVLIIFKLPENRKAEELQDLVCHSVKTRLEMSGPLQEANRKQNQNEKCNKLLYSYIPDIK